MRGAGAADSRVPRPLSSRHPSGRFLGHEEAESLKAPTMATNRPSSALKSTGHRVIYDELVQADPNGIREASPKATTPLASRQSPSRLSGHIQVHELGISSNREEVPVTSARLNSSSSLSQPFSARLQPHDIEVPVNKQEASPTLVSSGSSGQSSAAKQSRRLQVHDDTMSTSTQEISTIPSRRSRPSSPAQELDSHLQERDADTSITNTEFALKLGTPLLPLRQLSERLKLHDNGAATNKLESLPKVSVPSSPIRQLSDRLQIHDDGAITSKRDSLVALPKTPVPTAPGAVSPIDTWDDDACDCKTKLEQHDEDHQPLSNHEFTSDILKLTSSATPCDGSHEATSRFVPLHSQWTYGQAVFGRHKKTPYFYSGNIATYLGAGMFMLVFDDGTLDYRVRREDIMLREYNTSSSPSSDQQLRERQHDHQGHEESENVKITSESLRLDSFSGLDAGGSMEQPQSSADAKPRRKSTVKLDPLKSSDVSDLSAPEQHLFPSHHVMVDFSVVPPKEMILSFDDTGNVDVAGCTQCGEAPSSGNGTWRGLLEDETVTMKRLECGVGYEDDSTQVSDSDESSEEDMSMTPWQQMTQTFGMGKAARGQRGNGRRSSISSISQVDRLSMTQKSMKQIIPSPKSLKQIITEYFMRGNKKVQPSKLSDELALAEHIRLMEAKRNTMKSVRCNATSLGSPTPSAIAHRVDTNSFRVVYERAPDGVRAYGTVTKKVDGRGYAVVTEDEQSISVQVVPENKVDFLPSVCELEQQLSDLERSQRVLYAGQKVHVSLYPGSRFSGRGLITLEREYQSRFHILLANRIRLVNVPADKISLLREKKKAAVTITEDQFLICNNKTKVYIGDQIYVKCSARNGDLDSTCEEEKLGLLNGIYSNRTAAVDFADGSTGYEVPPHLIYKRKRACVPADQDVRSLKNAVLMQATAAANGGTKDIFPVIEEGYQVKADHPRKAAVESCIVIKTHASSACDLRFSDGTIAFEVFPSQMIFDSVEHQRTHLKGTAAVTTSEHLNQARPPLVYAVGDYVLAWSSRFGRYCSAKIIAKTSQDLATTSHEVSSSPSACSSPSASSMTSPEVLASPTVHSIATMASPTLNTQYTLVFDYGEQKAQMPPDKITQLDDLTALSHSQRLTNYSIDTMGFELSPVNFTVGEAVMARVHGSVRYFNGIVEAVNEKERVCAVCFDSSERDTAVPFSAMFSVDLRSRFTGRSSSTKQAGSGGSSSSGTTSKARFLSRHLATEDLPASEVTTRPRRHSSSSVGNMMKSMVDTIFRGSKSKPSLGPRRASHMITEIGARVRLPER
ncbi:unnamed protein product [Phytophthora lilii]|uniref:Unnamed protein product n=1 Tax=Phytophthora lilii TaxID=2077276 RepID=A0A9W6TC06_9STRA|nr:unnamed protein product [Phytophthora lilii]